MACADTVSWTASATATATLVACYGYERPAKDIWSALKMLDIQDKHDQKLKWKEPKKQYTAPVQIPKRKYPYPKTFTGLRFRIGGSKK